MPKSIPKEFREDVIRSFRDSESSIAQVAKDFGVSEFYWQRWLAQDHVERGTRPGVPLSEPRELRHRNRLLEQENEVLRRAAGHLSQANLPGSLGK